MKKFVTLLVALLILSSFVIFADETIIKWTWEMNDPDVVAFRYQVNGQADDGWKVVGTNETTYSLRNVTPGDTYTLYLQQSYDRLRWSESSESSIIAPMTARTESETPAVQSTEVTNETVTEAEPVVTETPESIN